MEDRKTTFPAGTTEPPKKTGAKGLIISNRTARSVRDAADGPAPQKDPDDGSSRLRRGAWNSDTHRETELTARDLPTRAETPGTTGPTMGRPAVIFRRAEPAPEKHAASTGVKFGMIGGAEQPKSSRIVFSNRKNRPIVSSAYFIAINGEGETSVVPVLDGMLIGSVWGTSTIPDIALSSDADRKQGEVFLEGGKIFFCNNSKRCKVYQNNVLPMTDRFEIRLGDILRIHNAFDMSRASDTILILVDKVPGGLAWNRVMLAGNANETVQLVREDDPTLQSVFFAFRDGHFSVAQISGDSGFFVNNRVWERGKDLDPMDVLSINGSFFVIVGNSILCQVPWKRKSDSERRPPVVRPGGLTISIRERKVRKGLFRHEALLRDIRLLIPKGSLVLILGGSGAGKTTFINAVMGYEPADGVITYDGIDIYREYDKMKYAIGYVQQEDLLRKTDVVEQTLMDSAKMHLARGKADRSVAVAETMKLLGLEKERDKLVGQLSGGQRKRLSIGVEYVGEPLLFFLDEPDSGLDGSNADNMWDIVRKIADTGKIVMVISHIPDRAFDLFDQVVVLAKDKNNCGRLAFAGTPKDACGFFGTERLEEIVKRINRVNEGGEGRADEFITRFAEAGYGRA